MFFTLGGLGFEFCWVFWGGNKIIFYSVALVGLKLRNPKCLKLPMLGLWALSITSISFQFSFSSQEQPYLKTSIVYIK